MPPVTTLPSAPTIPVTTALPDAVRAAVEQAAGYAAQANAAGLRERLGRLDGVVRPGGPQPAASLPSRCGRISRRARWHSVRCHARAALGGDLHQASSDPAYLDTRHPAVRDVMRGIRRAHGVAPRRAQAATTAIVRALVGTCGNNLMGVRDRALLLVGFASALRRSELVGLDLRDVEFTTEGVRLGVQRSKTDQDGEGATVGVLATETGTCPVRALRTWLGAAEISYGRVFRSLDRHGKLRNCMTGEAVGMVVQRRAALAGLDPAGFSAHSLRAGLATSAAAAGVAEADIARQTRHRSVAVLRGYVRHGSVFLRNASGAVGL